MTRLLWLLVTLVAVQLGCMAQLQAADDKAGQTADKVHTEKAIFAGGCFWRVQYFLGNEPGVVKTTAGYCGGTVVNPTYQQVLTHKTGHAESVLIEFDPTKTTYHRLLEGFFAHIDPTTLNSQGPDYGPNYRSVIFCTTPQQVEEATKYKDELQKSGRYAKPIVTTVEKAGKFYPAEEYHQNYFKKHGQVCH